MPMKYVLIIIALFVHLGCNMFPRSTKHVPNLVGSSVFGDTTYRFISVQYLGSGGLYLIKDKGGILIDPFFSHQGLLRVLFAAGFNCKNIKSDTDMVSEGWDRICKHGGNTPNILAMFVAHSHYDHLLDVPAVYQRILHQPKPKVYLNNSGYNTCYKVLGPQNMVMLEDSMSRPDSENSPIILIGPSGNKIKVYAILAQHNPHIGHIKAFDGAVTSPVSDFSKPYSKTHGNDWLEGNTFSFLIDYLDSNDNIELRVFVQSSSCNPNAGFPPASLLKGKDVDIAFLGVASYQGSPEYPDSLLKFIHPKKTVWIHWEDFFRKYTRNTKTVRGTDVKKFYQRDTSWYREYPSCTPFPGSILTIGY
jgi:hypothetical protein